MRGDAGPGTREGLFQPRLILSALRIFVTPLLILKAAASAEAEEVCPPSVSEFPELMERMAEVASGLRTHFQLSAQVDASMPVEVLIDGVPVSPTDVSGVVWTLQAARNEVRLRLDRTPNPGQRIQFRYYSRQVP